MGLSKNELFEDRENALAEIARVLAHPARIAILQHIIDVGKSAFSVSRSCSGMCVTSHSMEARCSAGTCANALSISGLAARARPVISRKAAKATNARETGFIRSV